MTAQTVQAVLTAACDTDTWYVITVELVSPADGEASTYDLSYQLL